jgi:hypothetical protein
MLGQQIDLACEDFMHLGKVAHHNHIVGPIMPPAIPAADFSLTTLLQDEDEGTLC